MTFIRTMIVSAAIAIVTVGGAAAKPFDRGYSANPNDFQWLRKDFNPSNYSWMSGKGAGLKPPGMPLTFGTAPFPKGWKVTPKGKGQYTLTPPSKNKGGGKGGGKKGR